MGRADDSASFLTRTGQWLVYALFRCVEGLLWLLPLVLIWHVGRLIGTVAYVLAGKYRKLALHNLRIALGREKSAPELRRIAREHFKSLFANILCGFKLPLMPEAEVAKRVTAENMHHLQAAFDAGRPLLHPIMHASCWEIMTQVPSLYVFGHKPASIYQPLRNPYLNALVLRRREKLGYKLFDRQEGFTAPIRYVRDMGMLGILVDQHAGDHGLWCPFFDRLASTTNIVALCAIRTNAVILPMMVYDDGPARWRYVCDGPLTTAEDKPTIDGITLAINQTVERLIRQQPASWFWVHNRWKTKPYSLFPRQDG